MDDDYTPTPRETIEKLWPEPEFRPSRAWKHSRCGLIVTNRAGHDDPYSEFRCPEFLPEWVKAPWVRGGHDNG